MSRDELANAIHALSIRIEKQQQANFALTERIARGLTVGVDLPRVQTDLSKGVAILIDLVEEQDALIRQWFDT